MSKPPRVSVLLAVHNDARYLPATLASILGQTYGDFELLAVDDASTDTTPHLLQHTGDARVRYIRNERNLGQVPSLNLGLALCRGAVVARIDGDDLCEPTRLAEQVAYLEAHQTLAGCATWTAEIDDDDHVIGAVEPLDDVDHVRWTMAHTLRLYHPSMAVRQQAYATAGGYDERYPATEDYELWTRMVASGMRLGVVPRRLIRYRRRPGQLSALHRDRQQAMGIRIASRYLSQTLGRHYALPTVTLMRQLLSWNPLPKFIPFEQLENALALMADWRRQTLADAAPAARAAADVETAEHLRRHGKVLLATQPRASGVLAAYLLGLPLHRSSGARLAAAAARCLAGTARRG